MLLDGGSSDSISRPEPPNLLFPQTEIHTPTTWLPFSTASLPRSGLHFLSHLTVNLQARKHWILPGQASPGTWLVLKIIYWTQKKIMSAGKKSCRKPEVGLQSFQRLRRQRKKKKRGAQMYLCLPPTSAARPILTLWPCIPERSGSLNLRTPSPCSPSTAEPPSPARERVCSGDTRNGR